MLTSDTLFSAREGHLITKLQCSRSGVIVGEERDPEQKRTSLFAVDLAHDRTLWSGIEVSETWWLSIEAVGDHATYIQHYAEGPLPSPAGVTAIDVQTGKLLWSQPNVTFVEASSGSVTLLQRGMMREVYFAVDRITGEMIGQLGADEVRVPSATEHEHLSFPHVISPEEIGSGEVESILASILDLRELRGAIEYHRHQHYIVLGYYIRDTKNAQTMLESKLVQELHVVDAMDHHSIFREQLGSSLNYPVQGSYFLYHDQLLYVKDSNQLQRIRLD